MKLSEHTTSVLKNFASINQNLVIKEGKTISTMSAMKNIVAKAEVDEDFPREIAIYDLNDFDANLAPLWRQYPTKTPQRCLQEAPRRPKLVPKTAQEAPKTAP